jgi:hypothetical protein
MVIFKEKRSQTGVFQGVCGVALIVLPETALSLQFPKTSIFHT